VGAEVQANSKPLAIALTDGSGRFELLNLAGDSSYTVSATAEGHARAVMLAGRKELQFTLVPEAIISGSVLAERDGSPVAGARVGFSPESGQCLEFKTDTQGHFLARNLPAGPCACWVDHPDFGPTLLERREVISGEKVEGLIAHLQGGWRATGKVIDGLSGGPVAGADVAISGSENYWQRTDMEWRRSATSDPSGAFELKGLRNGDQTLSVRADGYLPHLQEVSISADSPPVFTTILKKGGSISGTVVDSAGRGIEGVRISMDEGISPGVRTDLQGRYRLEGAPEDCLLFVSHRDFLEAWVREHDIADGEERRGVDFQLSRGGAIEGRVVDAEGRGAPGIRILESGGEPERSPLPEPENDPLLSVPDSSNDFPPDEGTLSGEITDSEGRYSIPHLRPGDHVVQAEAEGMAPAFLKDVRVVGEETTHAADLELKPEEEEAPAASIPERR
jgi:hypothetical protein